MGKKKNQPERKDEDTTVSESRVVDNLMNLFSMVNVEQLRRLAIILKPYGEASYPTLVATTNWMRMAHAKYWTDGLGEILWSLLLLFFGGQFALTILAIQAFRQAGGAIIRRSLSDLVDSFHSSMKNFQKEPDAKALFDRDGDGIVTWDEVGLSIREVLLSEDSQARTRSMRMLAVCMRCVDPNKIIEAIIGMWAGTVGIIAILKSGIAKGISNGARIGQHALTYVRFYSSKHLYEKFPDYKNWVDASLQVGCSVIGIIFSLLVVRMVNAFNSALDGAHRLSELLLIQVELKGFLKDIDPSRKSQFSQVLFVFLVFIGLNWQLSHGFGLPWYLRPFLLPFTLVESVLTIISAF